MPETSKGACFCGAVEFEVSGTPAVMGYCHCDDCAEWSAAPVNAFSLWPEGSVRLTRGEDHVGTFNKTAKVCRKFCKTCGGHLFSELPVLSLVEVYPSIVPGLPYEPTLHVHYALRTLSIRDGLPKFKDLPAEIGGSGEMLPE